MPATVKGLTKLKTLQMGLETVKGTAVAATHVWLGPAFQVEPEDKIELPRYLRGIPGGLIPEDTFMSHAATKFVLGDTPFSVEQAAYLYNMAINKNLVSAGLTPFLMDNFALPISGTVNDFATFTFEFSDGIQAWNAAFAFCTDFNVHGARDTDGGTLKFNGSLLGRKRATLALTAGLSPVAVIKPLNIRSGTVKIDALGTAFGTAAATSNWLLDLNINVVTGLVPDYSVSNQANLDYAGAYYNGDHRITGKLVCYMDALSVTQIANARSATGIIMQLAFPGAGTRKATFNLPIIFTKDPNWGHLERNGFNLVELDFESGYSTTVVAQGPQLPLNMSASTTIT